MVGLIEPANNSKLLCILVSLVIEYMGGRNFGLRNFRPGLSDPPENSSETPTGLTQIQRVNHYKTHSAEQYVVVLSRMTWCLGVCFDRYYKYSNLMR